MNIGIITIQKTPCSFGAALQSYALWRYLKDQSHNVKIIDLLRPCHNAYKDSSNLASFHSTKKRNKESLILFLKEWMNPFSWRSKILNKKWEKEFYRFSENAEYTRTYQSVDDLYSDPPKFDVYISGSDQVWNTDMPFEVAPYMLDFVKVGIKMSYASSFGKDNVPQELFPYIQRLLSSYDYLSVREQSSISLLNRMGLRAISVVDPTFLVDSGIWYSMCTPFKGSAGAIFYFSMYGAPEFDGHVSKFACEQKRLVMAKQKGLLCYPNRKNVDISYVPPTEWLTLIKDAEYVITDSFHATVFSIIFKKKFVSIISNSKYAQRRKVRIVDLLTSLGLQERLIYSSDAHRLADVITKDINYEAVSTKVNFKVKESKIYLQKALAGEL